MPIVPGPEQTLLLAELPANILEILPLFSCIASVVSAIVAFLASTAANQARKAAQDTKSIEDAVAAGIQALENRWLREGRIIDPDFVRRFQLELMNDVRKDYVERAVWLDRNHIVDKLLDELNQRYSMVDKLFDGVNHRIRRNTELTEMALQQILRVLSALNIKPPAESARPIDG